MNYPYEVAGISKQAVLQYEREQMLWDERVAALVADADVLREAHPGCGIRKMYSILRPDFLGRDRFIDLMMSLGYGLKRRRRPHRTTIRSTARYPNLIRGMKVRSAGEIWQSDLTYYRIGESHYYAVFIVDVYTKCIVGHQVSDNMRTKANKLAFCQAFAGFGAPKIHHSDRGTQYASKAYVGLLRSKEVEVSMCDQAYENSYAERINGTIKGEYLDHWKPDTFAKLKRQTRAAVENYNTKRPHDHLNGETPMGFHERMLNTPLDKRPVITIFEPEPEPKTGQP